MAPRQSAGPSLDAASEADNGLNCGFLFRALGHVCLSSANAHCVAPVSGAPIPSDLVESRVLGCFYASRSASSAQRLGLITHKPFNLYCKHSKDQRMPFFSTHKCPCMGTRRCPPHAGRIVIGDISL